LEKRAIISAGFINIVFGKKYQLFVLKGKGSTPFTRVIDFSLTFWISGQLFFNYYL
jgi:hypothetical protein